MEYVIAAVKYLVYGVLSVCATLLTWILSPVLSALSFTTKDGNLPRWCSYFQTHDNPLSAAWEDGYYPLKTKKGKWILGSENMAKWYVKMTWLCRNPAYGFAHYLFGYQNVGADIVYRKSKGFWDTNKTNWEFMVMRNSEVKYGNSVGFHLRGQFYYSDKMYIRVWLGWKLYRNEPDGRAMLVTHINPLRSWKG